MPNLFTFSTLILGEFTNPKSKWLFLVKMEIDAETITIFRRSQEGVELCFIFSIAMTTNKLKFSTDIQERMEFWDII